MLAIKIDALTILQTNKQNLQTFILPTSFSFLYIPNRLELYLPTLIFSNHITIKKKTKKKNHGSEFLQFEM